MLASTAKLWCCYDAGSRSWTSHHYVARSPDGVKKTGWDSYSDLSLFHLEITIVMTNSYTEPQRPALKIPQTLFSKKEFETETGKSYRCRHPELSTQEFCTPPGVLPIPTVGITLKEITPPLSHRTYASQTRTLLRRDAAAIQICWIPVAFCKVRGWQGPCP